MNDLINFGSELNLKAIDDNTVQVSGYLVLFADEHEADFHGDIFTKNTDFLVDDTDTIPVYFNHGQDRVVGKRELGNKKALLTKKERGLWIEHHLNKANEYDALVLELLEARNEQKRRAGWSSGALGHLVERKELKSGVSEITKWVLGEASITLTPADYRNQLMADLKSLDLHTIEETTTVDPLKAMQAKDGANSGTSNVINNSSIQVMGENKMTDEMKNEVPQNEDKELQQYLDNAMKSLENQFNAKFDTVNEGITKALEFMEASPVIRKSGYFSVDGGKADANIKTFGDYLKAVVNKDTDRLVHVYGSTKAQAESAGSTGGYLVPREFHNEIIGMVMEQSEIYRRVRRLPVMSNAGDVPSLDIFAAPTAGVGESGLTAGAGGNSRAEGGSYTEETVNFELLSYRVNDFASGFFKVSREMLQDVQGIDALLRNIIQMVVQNRLEYGILRGSGAAQPTGILTGASAIGITPDSDNTFAYADATEMLSRWKSLSGQGVWIIHPQMITDIHNFSVGSTTAWVANMSTGQNQPLLGYNIIQSEHMPNPDTSGCVILADLGSYYLFERGGLAIDYSDDAFFTTGQGAFRFSMRVDGKSALKSTITLGSPNATTVSPFVYLND